MVKHDLSKRDELYVRKIKNGTVIDHIPSGLSLEVLKILKITGKDKNIVSLAMNVPSKKFETKDILKIDSRELKPVEVDRIALIAPQATINIIRDFEVYEKNKVKLPKKIKGIIKCGNPSCVTNSNEPVESIFEVERIDPLRIVCKYCNRFMERDEVLKQF